MRRTQLACYSLAASAFVLGAVLLVQLQSRSLLPAAHGEMNISSGDITAMTAFTRDGEESLFLLENTTQKLLIYRTDLARNQLQLVVQADLRGIFNTGGPAPAADPGRRPR